MVASSEVPQPTPTSEPSLQCPFEPTISQPMTANGRVKTRQLAVTTIEAAYSL